MADPVLPTTIDSTYRGRRLAIWLFVAALVIKTAMAFNCIFFGETVAHVADGIPLDAYPAAAAGTIVALFGMWGLAQLVLCLLSALALVRRRALVPFMYAVLLGEHLLRKLFLLFKPIVRVVSPSGAATNYLLLALLIVGLALSLWTARSRS